MLLEISKDKTIHDIQQDFNLRFPFLKLEFYKPADPAVAKKHLPQYTLLSAAGLKDGNAIMEVVNDMTVAELEKKFRNEYGLDVQVSRKSGLLWLETTMTDNWSLEKQNEHGKEISITPKVYPDTE